MRKREQIAPTEPGDLRNLTLPRELRAVKGDDEGTITCTTCYFAGCGCYDPPAENTIDTRMECPHHTDASN